TPLKLPSGQEAGIFRRLRVRGGSRRGVGMAVAKSPAPARVAPATYSRRLAMSDTREVVVLSGARTAIGGYGSSLKDIPPSDLAAVCVREAVSHSGVEPGAPAAAASWTTSSTRPTPASTWQGVRGGGRGLRAGA